MVLKHFSNFVVIFLFSATLCWGGENKWTPEKPYGGDIIDIDIDPQNSEILYVFCNMSGVFKSMDGGFTWGKITKDMELTPTFYGDLEIDPVEPNIIYFTDQTTIYKSIDRGESWSTADAGFEASHKSDIDISRFFNQQLMGCCAGITSGVYRSLDSGIWWEYRALSHISVYVNEYDNITPYLVYAGGVHIPTMERKNGFCISEDNGLFWIRKNTGLEELYLFEDIEIDPFNNRKIYITGRGAYNSSGYRPEALPYHCIYKTENQADSWTCINNGLEINLATEIKVHPNDSNKVYVCSPLKGLHKSLNGGQSWESCNSNLGSISGSCLDINKDNNTLYLGTEYSGLFKSEDDGQTWQDCNQGLYGFIVTDIEFNPQNSQTIYLGKYGQPYKSIDGGRSWQRLGLNSLRDINAYDLEIDPADTSMIYLGARSKILFNDARESAGGFYISFDGGDSWQQRNNGLGEENDVFSIDVFVKGNCRILYMATGKGVYRSNDLGKNWQVKNSGISDPYMVGLSVQVLKSDSNTVYAGFPSGLYKSIDGGASWSNISEGISGLGFFCFVDPMNDERIVLTCTTSALHATDGGAFYSENSGESWNKFDDGEFFSFAFDPNNSNRMLMGGIKNVKISENGFDNFESIYQGFDENGVHGVVNSVAFHPDTSNKFYCGIDMCGLFSYTKSSSGIKDKQTQDNLPVAFELKQNQPNPFNPDTKLKYEITSSGLVVLNIFNIVGEKITTLVREHKQAGVYFTSWDGKTNRGSAAKSGVYFAVLSVGDQKEVVKMTLLR
ncbi:hypothetical protein B6I21_07520 [candidate division KSB1 bacterium 4572_119]|nr:MAG: hypothetical protein B6I21_07520 [candidate division KSB1 bacterium 4572_119]